MSRHAPSNVSVICANLNLAGVLIIVLQYLELPYVENTYLVWPAKGVHADLLVIQWETAEGLFQEEAPIDDLILTVDQLTVVRRWLA